MDVLKEILNWSVTRPEWQRDALRRIVTSNELEESDIEELATICKSAHGLAERPAIVLLSQAHVPGRGAMFGVVKLNHLTHHAGVNALAQNQRIQLDAPLTIVFGSNASGKSGYSRILKRACRARGSEDILGNVFNSSPITRPTATINFSIDDQEHTVKWTDQDITHEALAHVRVFDACCAIVYIQKETDVAFRPFGLDVFDKLSAACEQVRKVLDKERRELESQKVMLPDLSEGTSPHKILSSLSSLTKPEDVIKLATLTDEQRHRLIQTRKELQDLKVKDTKKTAQSLTLQAQRMEALATHLTTVENALCDSNLKSLFDAWDLAVQKSHEVKDLHDATFSLDLLKGTGSDLWRTLWESARQFSSNQAYKGRPFPVTEGDARCVLCQQNLDKDAAQRLKRFEEFLKSTLQKQLDEAKKTFREQYDVLQRLAVTNGSVDKAVKELQLEAEELGKSVRKFLDHTESRRDRVLHALQEKGPLPDGLPVLKPCAREVLTEAKALQDRSDKLLQKDNGEHKAKLLVENNELEAREALRQNLQVVLNEIERKKKIAAYHQCLEDTDTHAITRKSTEVTEKAVTLQLAASFQDELKKLKFMHLEVELKRSGGRRGVLYHNLILKRAPGTHLSSVVSEGESRCLSLAAFFAELSTADDKSAIIFDDPVSSLDHVWRDHVANRLVEEAAVRQVIVFTHDVVFLVALMQEAERRGIPCRQQYLQRYGDNVGVCFHEIPWIAMNVNKRIGFLRKELQDAAKTYRDGDFAGYELKASRIYGLLREAWDRGVEEVLLGRVVERYRNSVQTLRARYLSDITDADCSGLENGMNKCSRWMAGHDQSPAENAPIPGLEELANDIDELDTWVNTINKRRQNK